MFPNTLRHTVEMDFISYLDELAEMIGCKPDVWRLLLTDPKLGLRVLCGPCVPSQFRLQGPGHWPGAREAILTVMDRVRYPLQTRRLPPGLPKTIERLREFFYPSKTWIVSLYLTIIGLLFWIIVN
ncbi:hypothetical protein C0Q70_21465 [Pomacea canaliculata]|uniref:Flavin-containing monooxygenase n=1 Tax=Pomacea canaliculata TaxID=400727 RepID=A0A2T7NCK7_POMCA|nr:hypothetical protein C0Q70_21465 [Pomacea canaliculata]